MMKYSVLMTVYHRDHPDDFQAAVKSILSQSVPTNDFVLVCDGPLSRELNAAVEAFGSSIRVVRLDRNIGLGLALNEGLKHCRNDLVARMDSDDISVSDRCEKQLKAFEDHPELSVVGGWLEEFSQAPDIPCGKRTAPEEQDGILKFSRRRSPFNHATIMYRKSAVEAAGGYTECYHLFEDYDLWVRMLKNGALGRNLPCVLLKNRVSDDMYGRRGGKAYAKALLRFHKMLYQSGWSSAVDYGVFAHAHALICVMPNGVRKMVYHWLHQ